MAENKNSYQRENLRHAIEVPIRLLDESGVEHIAVSDNVSDCGLYLTIVVEEQPALDSIVQIQVMTPLGDGSDAPINQARVIRKDQNGVGLQFIVDNA